MESGKGLDQVIGQDGSAQMEDMENNHELALEEKQNQGRCHHPQFNQALPEETLAEVVEDDFALDGHEGPQPDFLWRVFR